MSSKSLKLFKNYLNKLLNKNIYESKLTHVIQQK